MFFNCFKLFNMNIHKYNYTHRINIKYITQLNGMDKQVNRNYKSTDMLTNIDNQDNDKQCFNNMKVLETKYQVSDYINRNFINVNDATRMVLVDHLMAIGDAFKLTPDTLFLSVNYLDRILSTNFVKSTEFQLYSIVCLLIASKYEETEMPSIRAFADMVNYDNMNIRSVMGLVRSTEINILHMLTFDTNPPTSYWFLQYYLGQLQGVLFLNEFIEVSTTSNYLCEMCLLNYEITYKYVPSIIAAASLYCGFLSNKIQWRSVYNNISGYKIRKIKSCIDEMMHTKKNIHHFNNSHFIKKYNKSL